MPAVGAKTKSQRFRKPCIGRTAAHLSRKFQIPLVFTYHTRYEQYASCYTKGICKLVRRLEIRGNPFIGNRPCKDYVLLEPQHPAALLQGFFVRPVPNQKASGGEDLVDDGVNGILTGEDTEEYAARVTEFLKEACGCGMEAFLSGPSPIISIRKGFL